MFFSANDVGEMAQMVYNWEHDEVDAVVVSDGSRYNNTDYWIFTKSLNLTFEIKSFGYFL